MGDDDVPTKIDALMDWQFFSGILKRGIGPQCYDPPVPFKCLLIGQWHAPSDAKLERALRVRLDFVVFCGPDLHAPLPDETTPCRFRNVLVRGGVYDDLPGRVAPALWRRRSFDRPAVDNRRCQTLLTPFALPVKR